MTVETTPQRLTIKTASGGELGVTCPVCSHNFFISVRAKSVEQGVGFQHLIVGQEVRSGELGAIVALPVRFHACANCGNILKFLMSQT